MTPEHHSGTTWHHLIHYARLCYFYYPTIYLPADDLTDPAPVVILGHLDALTVLPRVLASKWSIYTRGPIFT